MQLKIFAKKINPTKAIKNKNYPQNNLGYCFISAFFFILTAPIFSPFHLI